MKSPLILSAAIAVLMSACANGPMSNNTAPFSQANLPDAVKVPAGHKVSMETVGVGRITYECREKAAMAGSYEWVFVGPVAVLNNRAGKMVGNYYGPPATWESVDGSKVTGAQVAVAPATAGAIPLQLVKANPAMGSGAMTGTAYIQRVATVGGVAPNLPCDAGTKGKQEIVNYQADYIFWTAG
jgi:hypothetical protein